MNKPPVFFTSRRSGRGWALVLATAAGLALVGTGSARAELPAAGNPAVLRALAHLKRVEAGSANAAGSATGAVPVAGSAAAAARVSAGDAFEARDLLRDADGTEHVRLERRHQNLRVLGGDLVVHSRADGSLQSLSLTQSQAVALPSLVPSLSAKAAARFALGRYRHSQGQVVGSELLIWARRDTPQLAWDVRINGQQSDGTPSEAHLIVSAAGESPRQLLEQWDDIHTAVDAVGSGQSLYSGTVALHAQVNATATQFTLVDATRGRHSTVDMNNGTATETLFAATNNLWGDGSASNRATAAADAAYGQAVTWDYFRTVHGRRGIANDGKGARSRVHYGSNYANAFWSDTCFCMSYGDGNGSSLRAVTSLDVAGHEMTHGITARTANLAYTGESGGLNEATSDIFGTMVEFHAANASDPGDYLIGEKVTISTPFLRSLIHPSDNIYSADCWYSSISGLNVHYSSGPANHFFYLLSEGTVAGKPSPTCAAKDTRRATGTGTVKGIGRTKAAKIWYRALTVYMTSATDYAGARAATIQAATDLYGAGSTPALAVAAAWSAVGRN